MALVIDPLLCPQNHRCPMIPICPAGAISQKGNALPEIDPEKCIECGKCVRHCGRQRKGMDKLCRIRDLQRAVNQFEAAFEKRYGICLNEGMALCSLSNAERMCPGRLGELLGLTPSNTSKVLRSAESKGLVLRELCCKDRRQMHYSLTTKGRELLASVSCREIEIPEILRKWLCG